MITIMMSLEVLEEWWLTYVLPDTLIFCLLLLLLSSSCCLLDI